MRGSDGSEKRIRSGKESHLRYPWTFSTSAFSKAAPAAPRMVLCERTANFQSRTPQGRRRPTVVVEAGLRAVARGDIYHWLVGCAGEAHLLGQAAKLVPGRHDFFRLHFFLELHGNRLSVTVFDRYAIALCTHSERAHRNAGAVEL